MWNMANPRKQLGRASTAVGGGRAGAAEPEQTAEFLRPAHRMRTAVHIAEAIEPLDDQSQQGEQPVQQNAIKIES